MSKNKKVAIQWLDATLNPDWQDEDEWMEKTGLVYIETIGFLIYQNPDVTKVAQTMSLSGKYLGIHSIPTDSILKIIELRGGR